MHPVTERFLLIERLDNIVWWSVVAYLVVVFPLHFIARKKGWKTVNEIQHWTDALVFILIGCYFYWKFFLAWKGIYY